jgi:transcription elongation factor GreA
VAREVVLTPEGLNRLERELEQLKVERRREVAERLRRAVEMGRELVENAEYLAAKEEQARVEKRIAELEERLQQARVVERRPAGGAVGIGARVRVRDCDAGRTEEYEIVGSGEGDPAAGRISSESPVGSALLDRRAGDVVDVETPAGIRRLEILEVV